MPFLAYLHKFVILSFLSLIFFLIIQIFLSGNADLVIFCLGDGTNDTAGDAVGHMSGGDTHAAFYYCPCTDEAVFFDDGTFLNDGTHADKNVVVDRAAVDDGVMADGHAAANVDIIAHFYMEGSVFLQVGVVTDGDLAIACAYHCAGIDDDIFPQFYAADDFSCGENKAGFWHFGDEVFIFTDHGTAPFMSKCLFISIFSYPYHICKGEY